MATKLLALDRVPAHALALAVVERAGPVEDVRIDGELADVVEHRDELDLGRVERIQAQIIGHDAGMRSEAVAVVRGRRVMQAQLKRQRLDRLRHPWSVGQPRHCPSHGG
jgi:hypothetical protein